MVTICTAYMCKPAHSWENAFFSVSNLTNSIRCRFLTVPPRHASVDINYLRKGVSFYFYFTSFHQSKWFPYVTCVWTIVFRPFHICWLSFFQTTPNNFPSINQPLKDEQLPIPETEIKNEGENAAPLPTPGFFKNVSDRVLKAKVKLLEAPYDVESWNILVKDAQVYNYVLSR